jgi:hypothetical protein
VRNEKGNKEKLKSGTKNKTRTALLKQSPQDNARLSIEIKHWMEVEYKEAIASYIRKYGQIFERRLGMTRDDMLNDFREQIWKGLVTYDPAKKANKRTYLNNVMKNRIGVLLRRTSITKYNSIDYYADIWSTPGVESENLETNDTPESIFAYREILMKVNYSLSAFDKLVNADLIEGRSLEEMEKRHRVPRSEIIGAIKRIELLKRDLSE